MSIVLITGCSSGFGKLAAIAFARGGDTVIATMRDTKKAGALQSEAKAAGVNVEVEQLDVTDTASVDRAVAGVIKAHGRIDGLVNNAAFGTHGPIESYDDDEVARIFDTNVTGVVRVTRAVVPRMRAQGSGRIINVSSLAGKVTAPLGGIYSASKHALESISDALYFELSPFGIRVVIVEPGGFDTGFGDNRHIARRFGEDSPYKELEERFASGSARLPGGSNRPPAQMVADKIVEVAHADAPNRRHLVGPDAEAIGGLAKRMSDEEFEAAMRATLDIPADWRIGAKAGAAG